MVAYSLAIYVCVSTIFLVIARPTSVEATVRINEARYRVVRRYNDICPLIVSHDRVTSLFLPQSTRRAINGIHLAATGEPYSMRVSWSSDVRCSPARVEVEQSQRVALDKVSASDIYVEEPYEMLYTMYRSGFFFHAIVNGLREKTRYTYRIQCGSDWSDSFSFTTPPIHGSRSPVRVLLLGDQGTRTEGNRTLYSMLHAHNKSPYNMVIHLGDISYANGGYEEYIWDVWADMVEPLAAVLPYMVTPGNHEILLQDSGGEVGIPYTKRFSMPMESNGSGSEYWYSWNYGQVHFVSVSSEHARNLTQQQWIEDDLRTANQQRHVTPWIVMFGHQSIYTSNQRHGNQTVLREWLDPLLLFYDVDILFWGHDHVYERTYPISNSTVRQTDYMDAKAPVHVICGASGWDLHECWEPNVTFSAYHNGHTWGYCALHVTSPTTSEVQFVNSETNEVVDSFRLTKSRRSQNIDIKQTNQNNLRQSGQDSGVDTLKDDLVVNTLINPDDRVQSATKQVIVDTRHHSRQPKERMESKSTKHVTASADSKTTEQTSVSVESTYNSWTSQETPTHSSKREPTTQVVTSSNPIIIKRISRPIETTIMASPTKSSTHDHDSKHLSTSSGLTVFGWIATLSLAGVLVASLAFYLSRRREKLKKYELVPLKEISPAGSDSEA